MFIFINKLVIDELDDDKRGKLVIANQNCHLIIEVLNLLSTFILT